MVVRRSISDLEQEIRRKHDLKSKLLEVSIEKDAVIFTFAKGGPEPFDASPPAFSGKASEPLRAGIGGGRRRRKRRVRNRVKTKGWDVLAKMVNTRGQTCTIYRPVFDALAGKKLSRKDAYAAVKAVLVSNGNDPNPSSVEYFLENTNEYIARGERSP